MRFLVTKHYVIEVEADCTGDALYIADDLPLSEFEVQYATAEPFVGPSYRS